MIKIELELSPEEAGALAYLVRRLDYTALGRIFRGRGWLNMTPPTQDHAAAWRVVTMLAEQLGAAGVK